MDDPLKDKFLSRAQHLKLRSCSKVLTAVNTKLPREHGISNEDTPVKAHGLYHYILPHVNLLVREHEIVAGSVSGVRVDGYTDDQVPKLVSPRIVFAANPRPDHYNKDPTKQAHELEVTLSKFDADSLEAPPTDAIRQLKYDIREAGPRGITLEAHITRYIQYLRACHAAVQEDEYNQSVRALQEYIYGACYPKMLRRFNVGATKSRDGRPTNLWAILTRDFQKLEELEHAKKLAIPEHLTNRKPDHQQAKLIDRFYGSHPALAVDRATFSSNEIYRYPADRLRFQRLLSWYLTRAKAALDSLNLAMKPLDNKPAARVDQVKDKVKRAYTNVGLLLNFMKSFRIFLEPHFKWLAVCANVKSFKVEPTWTDPNDNASLPLPVAPPSTSSADVDIESLEQEDIDDDYDQLSIAQKQEKRRQSQDNVTNDPYMPWVSAALTYAWNLCQYETFRRRISSAAGSKKTSQQKVESALIMHARYGLVQYSTARWDAECVRISEDFLKTFKRFEPDLNPRLLYDNLSDSQAIGVGKLCSSAIVAGTPHAESVLACLIAIVKDPKIMKLLTNDVLRRLGIFVIKKDLLDMLEDLIEMLVVSKKRCPSCFKTTNCLHSQGVTGQLDLPGSHTKWSGVLQPAFMPKVLVGPLLESMERETAKRLLEWQREKLEKRLTPEFTHSSSPQSETHEDDADKYLQVDADDYDDPVHEDFTGVLTQTELALMASQLPPTTAPQMPAGAPPPPPQASSTSGDPPSSPPVLSVEFSSEADVSMTDQPVEGTLGLGPISRGNMPPFAALDPNAPRGTVRGFRDFTNTSGPDDRVRPRLEDYNDGDGTEGDEQDSGERDGV